MIDFTEFTEQILIESAYTADDGKQRIIIFLEDNEWFGKRPDFIDGKVLLDSEQTAAFREPLMRCLQTQNSDKGTLLWSMLSDRFPDTSKHLREFFDTINVMEEPRYFIVDFLLYSLVKNVFLMNDKEVSLLVERAVDDLAKTHGDILTFFLSWLRSQYKTKYRNEYIMKQRFSMEWRKEAYDLDEYLELLYYLYNEDYIDENEMYQKAVRSKNYADTWLFLAIHFICSLRMTDLERITHPTLPNEPETILDEIKNGVFADKDARHVLLTITWRLCALPLTPNKTSSKNDISSIKFTVPEHCEVHIGTLFAICEAHRLLACLPKEQPLIRRISDYDRISKYMGDDIGSLFLESNFRSRSANKSYLQSVYMHADDILEGYNEGPSVKGYILAALARSHKGSFGEFANTTAVYLKDAKLSGLTPEFVAMELFERGVLSFIPSMLLKIITEGGYNRLSVTEQTKLIQLLDMSPSEIENTISYTDMARKQAVEVVKNITRQDNSEDSILEALHRVGSGSAFSKQPECLCILTALNKICPYNLRKQCVGCKYEISTKATIFLMVSEYNRLMVLYENTIDPLEKNKYKRIIMQVVLPTMDEILICTKDQYGQEVFDNFEQLIKENIL